MNNRELKDKVSNIQAIQAFVRENEHYYDAVVHGMSELSAVEFELISALHADIHMELALYLYFNNIFSFDDTVEFLVDKTVMAKNISSFNDAVKFTALKYLSVESTGAISSYIRPVVFRAVPVSMGILDTSITARIELTLAGEFRLDLGGISAGITADMPIVAEKRVITGDKSTALDMRLTKINLVRERYIRDMENLTVSEIEGITVEQVCCYRIV